MSNKHCFFSFLLCLFLCVGYGQAQTLQLIKGLDISKPISISVDKNDCVFIADNHGNINKYDSLGKLLLIYSPQKIGDIHILESWQTVRVFAFYRDFQEFILLDRFLNLKNRYLFPPELIGFSRVATISIDDNIWVFDDSDFSLKKLDLNQNILLIHYSLDLILDNRDYNINFIKEYQNILFINDSNNGILVFDNMGNYKKKLDYKGLDYFGVYENEIYFLKDSHTLVFFDLYTLEESKIDLPEGIEAKFAAALKNHIFILTENKLFVFKYNRIQD